MEFQWVLVIERVQIYVEGITNKYFGLFEFGVQKGNKWFRIGDYLRKLHFWAYDQSIEKLFHFLMKILLFFIFQTMKLHTSFTS
jgi:hypothetical protein